MAIEYIFETVTDLSPRELIEFFAQRMNCVVENGGSARRDSHMQLLVSVSQSTDLVEESEIFGDVALTNVTFRTASVDDEDVRQDDFIAMTQAVLAFFHHHPDAPGILAYQGELILLRRLAGESIQFDTSWEEFSRRQDDPRVGAITCPYEIGRLEQPFM